MKADFPFSKQVYHIPGYRKRNTLPNDTWKGGNCQVAYTETKMWIEFAGCCF